MTRTLEEHHKDCAAANNNFMCMCDCDLLEKDKFMTKVVFAYQSFVKDVRALMGRQL